MTDVVVVGAGPAGASAALRAAELGAHVTLVSSAEFGGMAANDGPVPVRALAHAARLVHGARQLPRYGIAKTTPILHYERLLARVKEIVSDVGARSALRERVNALGVTLREHSGSARFIDSHTLVTERGLQLQADRFILCTGGISRRLAIPGFESTCSHSDVWKLSKVPASMLVVGAGQTGIQLASIFNAFGTRIQLFEGGSRILRAEDADVAAAVASALRDSGVEVRENVGRITSFETTSLGIRMNFRNGDQDGHAEAELAVVAAGWCADTARLNLTQAGVDVDARGSIKVDEFLQCSVPHIFAAGDVTGRVMLVPNAIEDGFVAATNAVEGPTQPLRNRVGAAGSFSYPEYARVGLTEVEAREVADVVATIVPFDSAVRAIIEGQTAGFCKLVTHRKTHEILGCHVVGEHAVEIAQLAAIAIAAKMPVDELARVAVSFPTYAEVLVHAAIRAAAELRLPLGGRTAHAAGTVVDADRRSSALIE